VVTDSAGHFTEKVPASFYVMTQASKAGYVQQCAVPMIQATSDMTINPTLVSKANLTASPPSVAGLRSVSGVIVELTAAGKQPVVNAAVAYEDPPDRPLAFTYSDAAGRFGLCNLPQDQPVTLSVGLGGGARYAYATVPPGQTTGVEITLP
jgi:hypothetical protein